jgi:hypothetical protein
MSNAGDIPELEPLEELAAPAPAAPAVGAMAVTPVSLGGLPAPMYGARAQKEYYRFFFAGLVLFMGCLMPWGPEWEMAGWQTLKGGVFTIIALGIMWSSWVAISHGKFDLSSMRWLVLASLPLVSSVFFVLGVFESSAVQVYIAAMKAKEVSEGLSDPIYIASWGDFFRNLSGIRTELYAESLGEFLRYSGPGQYFVLFGSLMAELFLIKGVLSGIKTGAAQKKEQAAAREATKKSKRR